MSCIKKIKNIVYGAHRVVYIQVNKHKCRVNITNTNCNKYKQQKAKYHIQKNRLQNKDNLT